VRQAWGDVVGWSGLSKVAPNHAVAADLIRLRLEQLEAEAQAVTAELEARRTQLRADVASGVSVTLVQELELNALATSRVRLSDERRRLQSRLLSPHQTRGRTITYAIGTSQQPARRVPGCGSSRCGPH